ncbi:hypothetical protein TNCV_1230591 [Trichonephila clavipes]|nr:hypothetical protein TNCV_1230591 [Trichonephila clavipes]
MWKFEEGVNHAAQMSSSSLYRGSMGRGSSPIALVCETLTRESITGESPTSFPEEETTMPYSGFEPSLLQAEGHIHHTGWAAIGA